MKPLYCLSLALLAIGLAACATKHSCPMPVGSPAAGDPTSARGAKGLTPAPHTNLVQIVFPVMDEDGKQAHGKKVTTSEPLAWRFDQSFGMVLTPKQRLMVAKVEIGDEVKPDPTDGWDSKKVFLKAAYVPGAGYVLQLRFQPLDGELFDYLLVTTSATGPAIKWYPYTESLFLRATLLLTN